MAAFVRAVFLQFVSLPSRLGGAVSSASARFSSIGPKAITKAGVKGLTRGLTRNSQSVAGLQSVSNQLANRVGWGFWIYQKVSTLLGPILAFVLGALLLRFAPSLLRVLDNGLTQASKALKGGIGSLEQWRVELEKERSGLSTTFVGLAIDVFFFFVVNAIIVLMVLLECICVLVYQVSIHRFQLLVLVLLKLVFDWIEFEYLGILDILDQTLLVGGHMRNSLASVANAGIVLRNTIAPVLNAGSWHSYETLRVMYETFVPEDAVLSGSRRVLLDSDLENDPRLAMLRTLVNTFAYLTYLMNRVQIAVMQVELFIIEPILPYLMELMKSIGIGSVCAFSNPYCAIREGLSYIPLLGSLRCTKEQVGLPSDCGVLYANLRNTVNERKLSVNILTCEQRKLDGMWVESFNGRMLHQGKVHRCPLSQRAFHYDAFEVVTQMNQLGIDNSDCYTLCTNGIHQQLCYNGYQNVTRVILGTCGEGVEIKTHHDARRHLATVFPNAYFSWNDEPGRSQPRYYDDPDTPITQEEAIRKLKEEVGSRPFQAGPVTCKTTWPVTSMEDIFVQVSCIGYHLATLYGPKFDTPNVFRRHLEERQDTIRNANDKLSQSIQTINRHYRAYTATNPDHIPLHRLYRTFAAHHPPPVISLAKPERVGRSRRLTEATEAPTLPTTRVREPMGLAYCPADRPFRCACTSDCVSDVLTCPSDACSTYVGVSAVDLVHEKLQQGSSFSFNIDTLVDDFNDCIQLYNDHPNKFPLRFENMETNGEKADYCFPLFIEPIDWRISTAEPKGINNLVAEGCVANGTNACTCGWYYPSQFAYDMYTFTYISVETENRIYNAFLSIQWFFYALVWSTWPLTYVDLVWSSFWLNFGESVFPLWYIYLFGHGGLPNTSGTQRWICFGLHLGSLITLYFMVLLFYIFFQASKPLVSLVVNFQERLYLMGRRIEAGDTENKIGWYVSRLPRNTAANTTNTDTTNPLAQPQHTDGLRRAARHLTGARTTTRALLQRI